MPHPSRWPSLLLLITLTLPMAGCDFFAWMLLGGEGTREVDASYTGLDGRTVAVLVAADDQILYQHPAADRIIAQQVAAAFAESIPDIRLADPSTLASFKTQNPYWQSLLPSTLITGLGVDRLVIVSLYEYRLHEPGNAHLWRGIMSADISVIEAEAEDPDNPSFSTVVSTEYPTGSKVGVLASDSQTIELGLLKTFSTQTANLFHDHEVPK
ncbi:MAG: hypothetical protein RIG82_12540 [Phycisphaeraceae bacterium]